MKLSGQLGELLNELTYVKAETALIAGATLLLLVGLITKRGSVIKLIYLLTTLVALYFSMGPVKEGTVIFKSLLLTDQLSAFSSLLLLFMPLILIFPRKRDVPEFYFFLLAIGAGALFMIKANSLLLIYLSVELLSLAGYILTGFSFSKKGNEASMKYLLFGAVSSSIMLFGIGLLYGVTSSLYLSDMYVSSGSLIHELGILLFLFGLFFKSSIFPFHIWTPATYQEAPVDAVTIFSFLPKLAGILLLRQVCSTLDLSLEQWVLQLVLLAGILSILAGTLGALRQSNTRRMISFGSIAHSGFMLPLVLIDQSGSVLWWYAVVYGVMNMGAFYLIDRYESKAIVINKAYSRSKKQSMMGVLFTLILVSLVGLPPLAGFTAKFFVFSALWKSYLLTSGDLLLAYLLIAVIATVASLFYYLRIPYFIYLSKSASSEEEMSIEFPLSTKIVATIFCVTLLFLFFVPDLVTKMYQLLISANE